MRQFIFSFLMCGLCLWPSSPWAYDWKTQGERLTFDVNWAFLSVGQAELLYRENDENYQIIGRAWTGEEVNAIYNLLDRIRIDGTLGEDQSFLTREYTAHFNENDYRGHKKMVYDRQQNTAFYTNIHAGHKPKPIDIEAETRDTISALYYLRHQQKAVEIGKTYSFPVVDWDKTYTLDITVLGKEKMKTIFGKKEVLKIKPKLTVVDGQSKKKKNRLSIWVTNDDQYIPVKIEIDLPFGSFRAMLASADSEQSLSQVPTYLPEFGKIEVEKGKNRKHVSFPVD